MATKFTIEEKKTKSITLNAREVTFMQEKATAFILKRAFNDDIIFNSVDDIVKDKETVSGLKKIWQKNGVSLLNYKIPVEDKARRDWFKSTTGQWLDNFYQQQKTMLKEYGDPKWTVFNHTEGFMSWISNLVKKKFGVSKKDTWNPADIWLIQKSPFYRNKIGEALDQDSSTQTIAELNAIMRKMFKENQIVGVSLKKTSGATAKYDKINVDEKWFKNLEKRNGEYSYTFSNAHIYFNMKSNTEFQAADAHIYVKDNTGKDVYDFQLRGNSTSKFSNLKFEPNPIGGAAFLGKAPLFLVEKLVQQSSGIDSKLYNSTTKDHAQYPKNLEQWKKRIKEFANMFEFVRGKLGSKSVGNVNKTQFIENMSKMFLSKESKTSVTAHSKCMMLHILYYLMKAKDQPRDHFLTDIIFLAAKQGRVIKGHEFGPFGKLY